jgi:hypothetical protein
MGLSTLYALQWHSKSDVYITAELGDAFARTSTKWNNENPVYDETLDIWVPKGMGLEAITIRVFDDDTFRNEDDPLGSATFQLTSLREESNNVELKMTGPMSGECVVNLTATFLPFGGRAGVSSMNVGMPALLLRQRAVWPPWVDGLSSAALQDT